MVHIQLLGVRSMLQHRVELICRSHRGPQGVALRLFTAIACGVHTFFTAPYGPVNKRHRGTKRTTMAQDEGPAWKSINRRPSPESRQQPILIDQEPAMRILSHTSPYECYSPLSCPAADGDSERCGRKYVHEGHGCLRLS